MKQSQLSAKVKRVHPQLTVIKIQGEINLHTNHILMGAFETAALEGVTALVFNFERLEYMNSAGIGLWVTIMVRARQKGLHLAACCMNQHYQEIFSLTRLDEIIPIYANEDEAVQAAKAAVGFDRAIHIDKKLAENLIS
jgi:anti-sigma B factor antagonist